MSELRKLYLHDGTGTPIESLKGALNVHVTDVHYTPVNQHFHQTTATQTTLSVAIPNDGETYIITVADATGFASGDFIRIGELHGFTKPKIISIAGNTITLDRYLDVAYNVGDNVYKIIIDMNTVATLASPSKFIVRPNVGEVIHITRFLIAMVHNSAGDLGLFGNLPELTNGVLIRAKISGQFSTFTNWTANHEMKNDMFDVEFDTRSGGQGSYGTSGRGSFNRIGVVIRLDGDQGDLLEFSVRDDLTSLNIFRVKAQGHREGS